MLDLFDLGEINRNFIEITEDLLDLFDSYWLAVLPFMKPSTLAMPFVRMESEGFWHLVRREEGKPLFGGPESSVARLQEHVLGAYLDKSIYECLRVEAKRRILRSVLVGERYFSKEASGALLQQSFVNREGFLYSEKLLENPRDLEIRETLPLEEEYVPVRDQGFRRAVVTAYSHRCALCGIRVRTLDGHTAVTAAHIVPWSETHDDRPANGMALCRMCHWTFDEGLLGVSQAYEVIASKQLVISNNLPGYLTNLVGRGIVGPDQDLFWPDTASLRWHHENVFRM
ncbi:MAG TPA: HNH endonuclease [Rubrobacter sp.]|nr:HNH endonuclease [Rubrobacter sp.]